MPLLKVCLTSSKDGWEKETETSVTGKTAISCNNAPLPIKYFNSMYKYGADFWNYYQSYSVSVGSLDIN